MSGTRDTLSESSRRRCQEDKPRTQPVNESKDGNLGRSHLVKDWSYSGSLEDVSSRKPAQGNLDIPSRKASVKSKVRKREDSICSDPIECASESVFSQRDMAAPEALTRQLSCESRQAKSDSRTLMDINVNKQQRSGSEVVSNLFLWAPKSRPELPNFNSRPWYQSNNETKENVHSESNVEITDEYSLSGIQNTSTDANKFVEEKGVSPVNMSGDGGMLIQQQAISNSIIPEDFPQQIGKLDAENPSDGVDSESAKDAMTGRFSESAKDAMTGRFSESDNNLMTVHAQVSADQCQCDSWNDLEAQPASLNADMSLQSSYRVPENSYHCDKGRIILHQHYPDLYPDFHGSTNTSERFPALDSARTFRLQEIPNANFEANQACLFDDSIFPTHHRLATSEDLNVAMKRARCQKSYCFDDPRLTANTLCDFAANTELALHSNSMPRTTRGDLQLKYRQIMSIINRRSFNRWRNETSARAGHTHISLEQKEVLHPSWEKIMSVGCPGCLGFNMSNRYGRHCHCEMPPAAAKSRNSNIQKSIPSENAGDGSRQPEYRCSRRPLTQSDNFSRKPVIVQRQQDAVSSMEDPGVSAKNRSEHKYRMKFLLENFELTDELARNGSTMKANSPTNVTQLVRNDRKISASSDETGVDRRDKVKGEETTSSATFDKSISSGGDSSFLHSYRQPQPRPMREWEITKLEVALKCRGKGEQGSFDLRPQGVTENQKQYTLDHPA